MEDAKLVPVSRSEAKWVKGHLTTYHEIFVEPSVLGDMSPDATYVIEEIDDTLGTVTTYHGLRPELRDHDVRFDLTKAELVTQERVPPIR